MSNLAASMPFATLMGVEVEEATPERVVGTLLVRDDLCTAGGILHGGAIMAFADSLGAIGGFLSLPEGAVGTTTLESKTNFLGGAGAGKIVRGETTPVHRGKRTSVWQTKITSEDGKAVALVIQTQMALFASG
ncbi:PaaI family thioesterase [Vitreimonas sp.]|uniref:PaaI family thioesterase n=1 Tax=Vitreimonas sp. TaxID=3069702 RepID=UPI002EDB611B